jgi:lactate permease
VDPVVTVAGNVSGGVIGKMISPPSIAVAAAAGNLVGKESELFRFTVKHSFIMLILICFIVLAQAYVFKWIIPEYHLLSSEISSITPDLSLGLTYIFVLAIILIVFIFAVRSMKNKVHTKPMEKVQYE